VARRHQLLHIGRVDEQAGVAEEFQRGEIRRGLGRVEPVPEQVAAAVRTQRSRDVARARAEIPRAAARRVQRREACYWEEKNYSGIRITEYACAVSKNSTVPVGYSFRQGSACCSTASRPCRWSPRGSSSCRGAAR
jgi:hypothetical protein